MSSRRLLWLIFAACLAVVLAAMGWISLAAIRLDRAETSARRQTETEEKSRLALWRIDTALTPLLGEESARPIFFYWPFFPAGGNLARVLNSPTTPGTMIPSPLLRNTPAEVVLYFQFGPDGRLTSPELPSDAEFAAAVPKYLSKARIAETKKRLAEVARAVDLPRLKSLLPDHSLLPLEAAAPVYTPTRRVTGRKRNDSNPPGQAESDFQLRNDALTQNQYLNVQSQQMIGANNPLTPMYDISGLLMPPLWVDGRLLLARRFNAGNRDYVQGCVLDWPTIRASLLDRISDLLPDAALEPVDQNRSGDESHLLAALPIVRLVPGTSLGSADSPASPIVLSLAAAWVCVAVAAAAVGVLIWGVMRLSERRAAFVSAVTHELRTPLTTFQMYAEMLAEGMVPDVEQQHRYLCTLRNEAIRLTHLVENVLAYARLERGRTVGRIEPIGLLILIEGIEDRLHAHAEQAGMKLEIDPVEENDAATVLARALCNPHHGQPSLRNSSVAACLPHWGQDS